MNIFKKLIALLVTMCLLFCVTGCDERYEPYDSFNPAGVVIVDCINGNQYLKTIDDAEFADKMFVAYKKLKIDTDTEGELDSAYLYLEFYNKDKSTLLIFTIYENGSCCLGREYEDLYTVEDGRKKYVELCDIYESYED